MNGGDWAGVAGAAGTFLFLIVVVWQIAATWRARMLAAREEQYKQMALKYQQLLEDNIELHRRSLEQQEQAQASLASMERMMREIE
ncbi:MULTISPECIES: hypothetical protein [unclassified Streptomyces]|uniref:hypothetical protein n=1 Tax=unclassified Streptomyces TaxID=2593676 RepID=UPI0033AE78CF